MNFRNTLMFYITWGHPWSCLEKLGKHRHYTTRCVVVVALPCTSFQQGLVYCCGLQLCCIASQVLLINPVHPGANLNKGNLYLKVDNFEKAIPHHIVTSSEVNANVPERAGALNNLGHSYRLVVIV